MTAQQKRFADYYHLAGCKNATEAAIQAGYSPKTARSQSSRLLTIVAPYLKELQAEADAVVTDQRTANLEVLRAVRDFDIGDVLEVSGQQVKVKPFRDIPPLTRLSIAGIKTTAHGVEVKFHSRLQAIDTLNKMCGYNEPEKMEHNVGDKQEFLRDFFGLNDPLEEE